ncbi:MAG: LamG domain-containing protein [Gammaproteobacteria bacterium]|nr:LamG domain-containing protein [Gammaproteobacteria bacterium]
MTIACLLLGATPVRALTTVFADDFEAGMGNWTTFADAGNSIGTVTAVSNSPTHSVRYRLNANGVAGSASMTSNVISLLGLPDATLSIWVQRENGSNTPNASEPLTIEYLDSGGSWQTLETFPGHPSGNDPSVQIYLRNYVLPVQARHGSFRVRVSALSANNVSGRDYWHVDDVVVTTSLPFLPPALAEWRMDEDAWAGSAGEVADVSGNGYAARAVNGPTTAGATPAIAGNPGTCRYGSFDRNNDYLELPASFPNLTGSFTITTWIRPTVNLSGDQRIFADDQSNSGGFALSLGDGGSGRLRLFSRAVNPVIVDSASAVINLNQWHFVAAVHDAVAKTRRIYVDGVAVTLSTGGTTSVYTGNWGTDSGPASIGGETDGAGSEAVPQWRFGGNIDEMRVYGQALDDAQIQTVMNQTHRCSPDPVAEWRFEAAAWSGVPGEVGDVAGGFNGKAASNNGSAVPTPAGSTPATPGTPGTCRYAPLARAQQQYVGVPYAGALNPNGAFSVAFWARVDGAAGTNRAAISTRTGSGNPRGWAVYAGSNDRWQFWTGSGNNGIGFVVLDGPALTIGTWAHVAVTFTQTGTAGTALLGTKQIYVNGTLAATVANARYRSNVSTDLSIGAADEGLVDHFEGLIDEARVYDRELTASQVQTVMAETHPCALIGVDHYAISHGSVGVTCEAEPVTFSAHDTAHALLAPGSAIVITVSTSDGLGNWSAASGAAGTFDNDAADDGVATYRFADGETAVTLYLTHTTPTVAPLEIDVLASDGASDPDGDPLEDPSVTFFDAAFRFYRGSAPNAIGTQIAAKESNLAPGSSPLTLRAVRTNSNTGACEARITGVQTVAMAFECVNPGTCQIGNGVTINDVTPIPGNPLAAVASYANVALDFGVTGTASLSFDYLDAGAIALHARQDLPAAGNDPAFTLLGASNAFVVRPFGFDLDSANPDFHATDANGTRFVKAGQSFDVSVRAVAWQAGDDADADGLPDASADLDDNTTTPNFGQETVPVDIDISHSLRLPVAPGATGTLTGGNSITGFGGGGEPPGTTTATLAFSEVGIIDLHATLSDYLGVGNADTTSTERDVGRFYPDRFAVSANVPLLRDECSAGADPFTYLDQPFYYAIAPQLTVTALNTGGAPTLNYGGSGTERFWKLATTLPRNYADQSGAAATFSDVQDPTVTLAGDTDFDGAGTLTLDAGTLGDRFGYARVNAEAPFDARADLVFVAAGLTDADGACYDPNDDDVCDPLTLADVAGSHLRFGRLTIGTALGSELLPLAVPMHTEYFDGVAFVQNDDDACTALAATDLRLDSAVEAGQTDGDVVIAAGGVCPGAGCSMATVTNNPFAGGDGKLTMGAPGTGFVGDANITLDLSALARDWLRFDWDGDGAFDDDPVGKASFGVFAGPRQIIYMREPW